MAKKQTYSESVAELTKIFAELENSNSDINMEMIEEKVKRAAYLLDLCKKQLHEINAELENIMEKLE